MAGIAKKAPTAMSPDSDREYLPRTALGRKLWQLRQVSLASSDEPLLDWEGVAREVAERRGEPEA